ncbi:MAG: ATP-binding protein [Nannocystaceae bacterium]
MEVILGADDLRLLGGRGVAAASAWSAVLGRGLAEILADGDVDAFREILDAPGSIHQLALDLVVGDEALPLVVEVTRVGGCLLLRGDLRAEESEEISDERLADHRLEELGVLVAGIAHDFNNILSAILGNAEFVAEAIAAVASEDADLGPAVDDIMTAADRSRELIAQMLGYAAKRRSLGPSVIDLGAMTVEMGRLLRASIPPRISLHYLLAENLPTVTGDASQLRQVIMNLIVNAADAIEDVGSITMRTGTTYADATFLAASRGAESAAEGDYVFVEFEDTGCGMTPATIERIFDPFFTTKSKGRGLGLAGVRSILGRHGGALLVASTFGLGSTFRVLLPVTSGVARSGDGGSGMRSLSLEGLRILVIDDEAMIVRMSARVLSGRGARVSVAGDGHQGIEIFAADPGAFECVLLNVAMPYIDGIEVAHELRALREDVPILFISGYARDEIERRITGFPRVAFLEKPFTSGRLIAEIRELLDGEDE